MMRQTANLIEAADCSIEMINIVGWRTDCLPVTHSIPEQNAMARADAAMKG
jgi:hypothetical protein